MNENTGITNFINKIARHSDIAMTVAIVGIILAMIIPFPPFLLDFMLSFNIAFALIILLISLYILRPLDFSSFPSVLLVTTLSRMALNVSSTRLILLHGHQSDSAAGEVIKSFGKFVVGGNYVVGFIVFLILVIIQFVVITKGAGRIAEVAARFTLDAMPGKQMSIDADMNAGLITEEEARERRKTVSREADFYGAMDGASKFVRGDAIVGIIIMFINIIGGLIIGVAQHSMSIGESASRYAILTVGDGLVSQLPALIISTASGFIVSRAASDSNFGKEVSFQFLSHPKVFAITSGIMLVMGLVPGLPKLPFLALAAVTGGIAYINRKGVLIPQKSIPESLEKESESTKETASDEESLEHIMEIDPMELEISHTLIPMVDPNEKGSLLDRIKIMRRQCAMDLGFIIPPIRIRDNIQLKPGEYSILIRGSNIATDKVMMGHYLAMNPGTAFEPIEGVEAQEPVFGLIAHWINENQKEKAELTGYTVVDPETVLITHITEIIKSYSHELLGRQELKNLLDNVKETHPNLVEELIPNLLSIGTLHKVCANLLKEQVSIRDMVRILETLSDYANATKDPDILTEYVRNAMARNICKPLLNREGILKLFTLDPSIEEAISDDISSDQTHLNLDTRTTQGIINAIAMAVNNSVIETQPIVLCSSYIRRHFKKMTERFLSNLVVIAYNEVPSNIEVQQIKTITYALN
jgi:flagellar biosynthesis protein FlhA